MQRKIIQEAPINQTEWIRYVHISPPASNKVYPLLQAPDSSAIIILHSHTHLYIHRNTLVYRLEQNW